ncbi:MAG: hypothetical protein A2275_03670 [Bacteroidetes bacterium RIFOXYA12_FULL_35_11]|nr:MAG: hypothetical protein A2X01_11435 [Bacteroidetes bacterium GWF2_35_48]OFY73392.1 MAG: hypothetical protein A2275_03670 [Bacteroidetes bacterium RIFOXYA12_FULL_35_11]HBX53669.1 hypothetical protein [Bacteroidales bacterium]
MKNLNNNTLYRRGITPSPQGILLFFLCIPFFSLAQINIPVTGSATYTVCNTNVYDNGASAGAYSNDCNGYVVLNPELPGNLIRVSGSIELNGLFRRGITSLFRRGITPSRQTVLLFFLFQNFLYF